MKIAFNVPINSVSFGNVSIALLREIYLKQDFIPIFPIGQVDLSSQKPLRLFESWIGECINSAFKSHSRNNPSFKLWHIGQSLDSYSKDSFLMTFHETDQLTEIEMNVLNNQNAVFVTSNYTKSVFEDFGVKNVHYVDLGFDSTNFWKVSKRPYNDDRIVFGMYGKLEHRKHHIKVLNAWAKKYGNNPKYMFHCAIFNPFLSPEDQSKIILHGMNGNRYWNINFLPYVKTNAEYNEILNMSDIVLCMSGTEGRGLPEFHSVALGKHAVGLNAHAYKDYLNSDNAVLISPNGKIPVYDNIFFKQGAPVNNGNIYNWDENDFLSACDVALERFRKNPVNEEGLKLKNKTYSDTLFQIEEVILKK